MLIIKKCLEFFKEIIIYLFAKQLETGKVALSLYIVFQLMNWTN